MTDLVDKPFPGEGVWKQHGPDHREIGIIFAVEPKPRLQPCCEATSGHALVNMGAGGAKKP